ncbi:MAG: hypothetical protein WD052_07485 [Bacteroidales bacterium]
MNRRIWIYLLLLALIVPVKVEAQRWRLKRYEAGIGLGTVHTFMDIGSEFDGIRSFQFTDSRVNLSTHAGYKILEDLTVKLDLNYLMIGGSDSESRDRSLSFTAHCFEPLARVDYNFLGAGRAFSSNAVFNRRGMVNNYGQSFLYVFAGAGGILSKAKVKDINGDEVIGNPSYSNNLQWGYVIPAGIGFKRTMDAYFDLAIEVGGRFTFTDLIDGYQHATASEYNDKYIITSVKAVYKIRNDRRGRPIFKKYGR